MTNTKHIPALIFLFIICLAPAKGQNCFTEMMKEGDTAYEEGRYLTARTMYSLAFDCPEIAANAFKRSKAKQKMDAAGNRELQELLFRKQRAQFQAFMQSSTAYADPTFTLGVAWQFLASEAGAGNPEIQNAFSAWYSDHAFYTKRLEPVYPGEELVAMKWGSQGILTASNYSRGDSSTGIIRLWNTRSGEIATTYLMEDAEITDAIFGEENSHAQNSILFVGYKKGIGNYLAEWHWDDPRNESLRFIGSVDSEVDKSENERIILLKWMPDDKHIFLGGDEGNMFFVNYMDEDIHRARAYDKDIAILSVDFAGDDELDNCIMLLASSNGVGKIFSYDFSNKEVGYGKMDYGNAQARHQGNEANAHVHRAAFLPYEQADGEVALRVITGGCSNRIAVYGNLFDDLERSKLLITSPNFEGDLSILRTPPDGSFMLGGDETGTVYLLDEEGGIEFSLEGHQTEIVDIQLDASGDQVATASRDGTILIWDLEFNRRERNRGTIALDSESNVHLVKVSKNGKYIVAGHEWHNLEERDFDIPLDYHMPVERHFAYGPSGNFFITTEGNIVLRYDFERRPAPHAQYGPYIDSVSNLEWPEESANFYVGTGLGTVYCEEAFSGKTKWTWKGEDQPIRHLAASSDGAVILAAQGGRVHVLDKAGKGVNGLFLPGESEVTALYMDPDGQQAFVGFSSGRIQGFVPTADRSGWDKTTSFLGHHGPIKGLDYDPVNKQLLSFGQDSLAMVWNLLGEAIGRFVRYSTIRDGAWTTYKGGKYIMLLDNNYARLIFPPGSYASAVAQKKLKGYPDEDKYLNFLKAGLDIPLDTLLQSRENPRWGLFAEQLYLQCKAGFFTDSTRLEMALSLFKEQGWEQHKPNQIAMRMDCHYRLDNRAEIEKEINSIESEHAKVEVAKFFIRRARSNKDQLAKKAYYASALSLFATTNVEEHSFNQRGKMMLEANYFLEQPINMELILYPNNRQSIYAFCTQISEWMSLDNSFSLRDQYLEVALSAIDMIKSFSIGRGKTLAIRSEIHLLQGKEEMVEDDIMKLNKLTAEDFLQFISDRVDSMQRRDPYLGLKYQEQVMKYMVQIPEIKGGLDLDDIKRTVFAPMSTAYLERGRLEDAIQVLDNAKPTDGEAAIPEVEAAWAYIGLVKGGEHAKTALKNLESLGNIDVIDDDEKVAFRKVILNTLNELEDAGVFSKSVKEDVFDLRKKLELDWINGENRLVQVVAWQRAANSYIRLAENSEDYGEKVKYQEIALEIIDYPVVKSQFSDTLRNILLGELAQWQALAGQPKMTLKTLDGLSGNILQFENPMFTQAEALAHVQLGEKALWKLIYNENQGKTKNRLPFKYAFLSDLFKLEREGITPENVAEARKYLQEPQMSQVVPSE